LRLVFSPSIAKDSRCGNSQQACAPDRAVDTPPDSPYTPPIRVRGYSPVPDIRVVVVMIRAIVALIL
jgi:hypothetical protein